MDTYSYKVLLVGDFHYGESYRKAGGAILRDYGYSYSTEYLRPFIAACDHVVVNLETPVARPTDYPSPYAEEKDYVHWADPEHAPEALRELGVDAVTLANNHSGDLGLEALEATLETLSAAGISTFGAGRTKAEAEAPYEIALPEAVGGGSLSFYGAFEYKKRYDRDYDFYAGEDSPGCATLSRDDAPMRAGSAETDPRMHISFPHWGPNYAWKSRGQSRLASRLAAEGYDLVVGHGSHAVQEVQKLGDRWMVYSLGNGNFQSSGRWKRYERENGIFSLGFWAVLEVSKTPGEERHVWLNLYPVYVDNKATNYQPQPVHKNDFQELVYVLRSEGELPTSGATMEQDSLGFHLRLDVAQWPEGARPIATSDSQNTTTEDTESAPGQSVPSAQAATSSEPTQYTPLTAEDWPDVMASEPNRYDSDEAHAVIREQEENGRNAGTIVITRAAERHGADIKWYDHRTASITYGHRRAIAHRQVCVDTTVSGAIVKNKLLTKQLLQRQAVNVPNGSLVSSATEAVTIAERLNVPVVVKPRFGRGGKGITVNLTEADEIEAAYYRAEAVDRRGVLVEEFIDGVEFRILGTPDQAVGAVRRLLPHVVGDGESSVEELIEAKNKIRRTNPNTYRLMIPMDEVTDKCLQRQGLSLESILPTGSGVIVRDVGGVSSGGDTQECLEVLPPGVAETAINSIGAIPGMTWGGADILVSHETGKPYLLELNTNAAVTNSTYPVYGQPKDLGEIVWEELVAAAPADPKTIEPAADVESLQTLQESAAAYGLQVNTSVTLWELVVAYLKNAECDVIQYPRGVHQIQFPSGAEEWFRNGADSQMLITTNVVLGHHRIARGLMRDAGVRVAAMKRIRSQADLDEFKASKSGDVVLVEGRNSWPRSRNIVELDQCGSGAIRAQHRPAGERMRVIASRTQALAILGFGDSLEARHLQKVSEAAVQSVRAIPSLTWAVVDVVLPEDNPRPVVEGIDLNVTFEGVERILAGSLEGVLRTVVGQHAESQLSH